MNLEVISNEKKPLLSRNVVKAKVIFEGATPSRYDVRSSIAKATKSKEDLVVVKHIYTQFGSQEAKIDALIYDDESVLKDIEKNLRKADAPEKSPVKDVRKDEKLVDESSSTDDESKSDGSKDEDVSESSVEVSVVDGDVDKEVSPVDKKSEGE